MSGLEMQVKNRYLKQQRIMQFLRDYCYAIYLGVFGFYLAGMWGIVIFGAIGFGFDRYITKRKNLFGECLVDLEKIKKIKNLTPLKLITKCFKRCALTYIYIGICIWIYRHSLPILPKYFMDYIWAPIMHHIVIKMKFIIPAIDLYTQNLRANGPARFIIVLEHGIVINWLIFLIFLPLIFQYLQQFYYISALRIKNIEKQNIFLRIIKHSFLIFGIGSIAAFYTLVTSSSSQAITNVDDIRKIISFNSVIIPGMLLLMFFCIGSILAYLVAFTTDEEIIRKKLVLFNQKA